MRLPFSLLPMAAALILGLLVIVAMWVIPVFSQQTTHFVEEEGEVRVMTWSAQVSRSQTFTWKANFTGDLRDSRVVPRIPFDITDVAGNQPAAARVVFDEVLRIDGVQTYRVIHQFPLAPATKSGNVASEGYPTKPTDINYPTSPGIEMHQIEIVVKLDLTTDGAGNTGYFEILLGPLRVESMAADSDNDGIPDARQMLPIHTGVVAAVSALLAAFASYKLSMFVLRR